MRDGGKGDKRRPLAVPEEQFNNNWDSIFNAQPKREGEPVAFDIGDLNISMTAFSEGSNPDYTYVERRVPEELEDEAHELIDNWLRSKGYDPEAI